MNIECCQISWLNRFVIFLIGLIIYVNCQTCPPLQLPAYGEFPLGSCPNQVNRRCLIGCLRGFELIGSSHRTCCENGSWTGDDAICINQQVRCPQLVIPNDSQLQGNCINYAGGTCTIRCFTDPPRTISVTCHMNSSWSDQNPRCTPLTCPAIIPPIAGFIANPEGQCSLSPGSRCIFACREGYQLIGSSELICTESGQWSKPAPTCDLLPTSQPEETTVSPMPNQNCPNLELNFTNGQLTGACGPGIPGQMCSFSCNPGFALVGISTLTCLPTGNWNGNLPFCARIICQSRPKILSATQTGNCDPGVVGQPCIYECARGFRIMGKAKSICTETGEWTAPPPVCQLITCPALIPPANGTLRGACSPGRALATCTLYCNECATPTSNPSLTCLETGKWSDLLPSCQIITCPRLPSPQVGFYSGDCSPGICGRKCVLECGKNYINSVTEIYCTPSGWDSVILPTCERITCPPLPAILNAVTEGACGPGFAGEACTYQCNFGYALVGNPRFDCSPDFKNWTTYDLPVCRPVTCPPLETPPGAVMSGDCNAAVFQQICRFKCKKGLNLEGEPSLTCGGDGNWDKPLPRCVEQAPVPCPSLATPPNAQLVGACAPGQSRRVCTIQCAFGTSPTGPTELLCQADGTWDMPAPYCIPLSCQPIRNPDNGFTRGDCIPGIPGKQCSFACDKGYRLEGNEVIDCQGDGTWTGEPPICIAMACEALAAPEPNGGLQGTCNPGFAGEQCSFTCPLGYRIEGATNAVCQPDGSWSAVPPLCILASCPSLISPICGSAAGTCSPGSLGENCTFACNDGCTLEGSDVLTCLEGGRWSDVQPICRANEPEPNPNPDPDPDPGNEPSPDPNPDGTTSNPDVTSGPPSNIICPALRPPRGGVLIGKCSPGYSGSPCSVVCSRGYRLFGSLTVTCTSLGQWSGRLGVCRVVRTQTCSLGRCCPPIRTPVNGRLVDCSNAIGGKCRVSCLSGYKSNIVQPLTCQTNSDWNYDPNGVKCVKQQKTMLLVWRWFG